MASSEVFEFRGVDNLYYAEVKSDTKDGITFGTPKWLSPVAEIARSTESSSESHYYDNKPMIIISSTGSDELTLTVAPVDLPTYADITGQIYDSNLGSLIEGERTNKYFAIGYRTKGTDGKYRYVWRYKGQFGIPDEKSDTEDDGTDTNNTELTWTGVSTVYEFEKHGKSAKAIICDERFAYVDKDTWFSVVQTEDTFSPKYTTPDAPKITPADGSTVNESDMISISTTLGATLVYRFDGTAEDITIPTGSQSSISFNLASTTGTTVGISAYQYMETPDGTKLTSPTTHVTYTVTRSSKNSES